MNRKESIGKLRSIVIECGGAIALEETGDGAYIDCTISKDEIHLYVIFTRFGEKYFAYGLNSDLAPSELYLDLKEDRLDDLELRQEEIFKTIKLLLQKKVIYHKAPSLFNKRRGFVELPVDGKVTKIAQKRNYLNLPED